MHFFLRRITSKFKSNLVLRDKKGPNLIYKLIYGFILFKLLIWVLYQKKKKPS